MRIQLQSYFIVNERWQVNLKYVHHRQRAGVAVFFFFPIYLEPMIAAG